MREEEFLFLIEEIGISLKLGQSAIALILEYYLLLTRSANNRFKSVVTHAHTLRLNYRPSLSVIRSSSVPACSSSRRHVRRIKRSGVSLSYS